MFTDLDDLPVNPDSQRVVLCPEAKSSLGATVPLSGFKAGFCI